MAGAVAVSRPARFIQSIDERHAEGSRWTGQDHALARAAGYYTQAASTWLARVDPGTHRRVKGLRLVTAYGLTASLGTLQDVTRSAPASASVGSFAASVRVVGERVGSAFDAGRIEPRSRRAVSRGRLRRAVFRVFRAAISGLRAWRRGTNSRERRVSCKLSEEVKKFGLTGAASARSFISASSWPMQCT